MPTLIPLCVSHSANIYRTLWLGRPMARERAQDKTDRIAALLYVSWSGVAGAWVVWLQRDAGAWGLICVDTVCS